MSTGDTSESENLATETLTSNTDTMDLSDTHLAEEVKTPYSNIDRDVIILEPEGNSVKMDLENDPNSDSTRMTVHISSIQSSEPDKKIEITLPDSKDKVEAIEIFKNRATESETEAGQVAAPPEDIKIQQSIEILTNGLENNVGTPKNTVLEMDYHDIEKTSSINLEEKLVAIKETIANTRQVEVVNKFNCLLSLAAEYASSDSESDIDERVPSPCEVITIVDDHIGSAQNRIQYRTRIAENDSTSEDTDSDSDSDDSDDTSESDSDSDSDSNLDDSTTNQCRAQPSKFKKTKSEFDDLPPIEELTITVPEELCEQLGEVSGIVEQLVIVRPMSGKPTLNLDSILFLEKGHRVLGRVFDVFGQVADPHYCVRFNSEQHIKLSGIIVGMEVYYSPTTEHTSLVFLHELVKLKGVDVSGDDDAEPPEFSDDEEERAYNQLQRQKQRQKPGMKDRQQSSEVEGVLQKRPCYERQRNPWSSDWQLPNSRSNINFGLRPPKWKSDGSQPSIHNSYSLQNPAHQPNQPPPNQYGQHSFGPQSQYPFNPYNNPYQQNNMFPSPNTGYMFGRPPGFRPPFNNYGPNFYHSNPCAPPPMSWAPPPPPPPPSSST
ncbi:H/ACA ribonucleoprotein complex non-core subunit NAF1 isoform X1 [Athalia rosae]|uniref:H/ACA ribonucleoprotein complex non-core subunit NAF1 isoform X1 n=3 Tax=Athalia rosae TaxID=37344 RepID=UPI002033DC32|nr:H/ACA ribonucleoprotein complex non-core subunit NAF1 isoform X1 [Athalia rosae]